MRRTILLGAAPILAVLSFLAVAETANAQVGVRIGRVGVSVGAPYYYGGYYPYYGYSSYPYYGRSFYYGAPYYYGPSYSRWYYPATYTYPYPAYTYSTGPRTYQSFYQGGTQQNEMPAHIRVAVPQNARVWFEDKETSQRGTDRLFVSPALTAGREYTYNIKASWNGGNGKEVTQTRQVRIRAGELVNVDLMPPRTQERTSDLEGLEAPPAPTPDDTPAPPAPR